MAYSLRDGLAFCVVGGRTIFLDVHEDRYFCCPLSLEADLQTIIEGHAPASPRAIDWLTEHRILLEDGRRSGSLAAVSIDIPQTSIPRDQTPRPSLLTVSIAVAAQVQAAFRLHVYSLRKMVDLLAKLKAGVEQRGASDESIRRSAIAFHTAGRLMSRRDRCLPHSIALATHYWKHGHPVDLVIGVRRAPFAAHCWVQDRQHVLNDEADHVRAYTPIWVL